MSYKRKCDPSTVLLSVEFGGTYCADSGFRRYHRCNMAASLSWIFRLNFLCSGEKRSRIIHLYIQSVIRTHSGLRFQLNSTDVMTQMADTSWTCSKAPSSGGDAFNQVFDSNCCVNLPFKLCSILTLNLKHQANYSLKKRPLSPLHCRAASRFMRSFPQLASLCHAHFTTFPRPRAARGLTPPPAEEEEQEDAFLHATSQPPTLPGTLLNQRGAAALSDSDSRRLLMCSRLAAFAAC